MSRLVRWTGALVAAVIASEAIWGDLSLIGRVAYLYAAINVFLVGLLLGLALEKPESDFYDDSLERLNAAFRHPSNRIR